MKNKIGLMVMLLSLLPFLSRAQGTVLSDTKLNIFTLGDSNGTFPHSWPNQLKIALPNATVFNISKSGRTIGFVNLNDTTLNSLMVIDGNLKKAAEFIKDQSFDFVIIELGTNDAKAIFDPRQPEVSVNLETLIKKIKNAPYPGISNAKIIIISPPPYGSKTDTQEKYIGGNKRVEAMSKSFEKIAKKNGCLFVNGHQIPGLDMETMSTDGLHMDAVASRKLIEPVVALMVK